jgi:hypothetical protein
MGVRNLTPKKRPLKKLTYTPKKWLEKSDVHPRKLPPKTGK